MRYFNAGKVSLLLAVLIPALLLAIACGAPAAPEDSSGSAEVADSDTQEVLIEASFTDEELSPETIRVSQDDAVTLRLETDQAGAFHIHGYDLEQPAAPGAVTEFQFVANATGRFLINFHGPAATETSESSMDSAGAGGHHAHDTVVESAAPVSMEMAAAVAADGGVYVNITTEGWHWAPEEVNGPNTDGAGHAHIYVDGEKVSRVYGPYHYLPSLAPGAHEVKVILNDNQHNALTWQGESLEATALVTIPQVDAPMDNQGSPDLEPVTSEAPMSLQITPHPDALGGYNLEIIPEGFEFSRTPDQTHEPGKGYALLTVNGETHNRLYVPWLQVPAQGEGMQTFTVALLNNEGKPYHYNGQAVKATVRVQQESEAEAVAADTAHSHDHGSSHSNGSSDHASGTAPEATGVEDAGHQHGAGDAHSHSAGEVTELEAGYLEVLP